MDASKDYYAVLGVLPSIEPAAIRAVYLALLKKYHPDVYRGAKEEAVRRAKEFNEAYDVLGDEKKREEYDRQRAKSTGQSGDYKNESSNEAGQARAAHQHEAKTADRHDTEAAEQHDNQPKTDRGRVIVELKDVFRRHQVSIIVVFILLFSLTVAKVTDNHLLDQPTVSSPRPPENSGPSSPSQPPKAPKEQNGFVSTENVIVAPEMSEIRKFSEQFTSIHITNPRVADVSPIDDRSIRLTGKEVGETDVVVLGEQSELIAILSVSVATSLGTSPELGGTLPAAARSALLVATADDPQHPIVTLGTTVWSTIGPAPGQPATVAVKADADIPDLKMHASMTLRKNIDPTLQATHTIDLKFSFAEGAPITGFKDVGLPQMRKEDSSAAEALTSVKVKISDTYFLIALAKGESDIARNLDLMQTRSWFDFPLLLNDDRIAKVVFQKSPEGEAMLEKAFETWNKY